MSPFARRQVLLAFLCAGLLAAHLLWRVLDMLGG